jgi:phage I-like protein
MRPFTALLDAPTSGRRFQIAALGDYNDSRYGEFSITKKDVKDWAKNLSQLPGGEALIDFEHRSEKSPRDSRAAGWITGIELDGDKVMADARWTPDGEQSIKDGIYRFVSPAYGSHTNEHGVTFENTLMSVALTNKPALTGMPAVVLASEERVSEAAGEEIIRLFDLADDGLEFDAVQTARLTLLSVTAADRKKAKNAGNSLPDGSYPINNVSQLHSAAVLASSKHGNWGAAKTLIRRRAKEMGVDLAHLPGMGGKTADSRQHDMDTAALITLLDLPEDADEAKILEAAETLKAKAAKRAKKDAKRQLDADAGETKTLDQQAADEGKIVLDQAAWEKTQREAQAGTLAFKQLHQQAFDTAFDKAVADRKAMPGEKDTLQLLYKADAETTLKMLDGRQPVMLERPAGAPSIEFDPDSPENFDADSAARSGVAPDSVMLDAQLQKHMRANNLPMSQYGRVLDQVASGELML